MKSEVRSPKSEVRKPEAQRRRPEAFRSRFALRTSHFALLPLFACLGGGFAVAVLAGEPSIPSSPPATAPARVFAESDLLALLTATLQEEQIKDRGELELRLTRPWTARTVPEEPLALKILDLPTAGVTPSFIVRFELHAAGHSLGTWQTAVQARVWREVWVAQAALRRGEPFEETHVTRERRDVLPLRSPREILPAELAPAHAWLVSQGEALAELAPGQPELQMANSVPAGAPLLARALKLRPVIRRGQSTEAVVRDGALCITLRVEALEDGAPGQIVRARNPVTRRDLAGRVQDAQTILISL